MNIERYSIANIYKLGTVATTMPRILIPLKNITQLVGLHHLHQSDSQRHVMLAIPWQHGTNDGLMTDNFSLRPPMSHLTGRKIRLILIIYELY